MRDGTRDVPCATCGSMLRVSARANPLMQHYHPDCGPLKTPGIAEALTLSTRQVRRLLRLAKIEPVRWCHGRYWNVEYYPRTTVEQLRATVPGELARAQARHEAARTPSTVSIDLLLAIFAVTRAAKRYRDAAARCYNLDLHGFAGEHRAMKEHCYQLKDRGIVAAVTAGRIVPVATSANLTLYRGEGYCFHSLLRPISWQPPATGDSGHGSGPGASPLFVEAKPRGTGEPRLRDAIATLSALPANDDWPDFVRIAFSRPLGETPGFGSPWQGDREEEDEEDEEDECY